MAISVVQYRWQTATSIGAKSLAFTSNVTQGNLLVVLASSYGSSANLSGDISDDRGNVWTIFSNQNSSISSAVAYCIAKDSGACTVTVNDATGRYFNIGLIEASGVASSPLDADDFTNYGSGSTPTAAITTIDADTLIASIWAYTGGSITITPDDTEVGENQSGSYIVAAGAYKIVSSSGDNDVSWSTSASISCNMVAVSFKQAAAGGLSIPVAMHHYMQNNN